MASLIQTITTDKKLTMYLPAGKTGENVTTAKSYKSVLVARDIHILCHSIIKIYSAGMFQPGLPYFTAIRR